MERLRISDKDRVIDLLIAEYETLRGVRERLTAEGESRGNFFLAVVSGSLIALGLIGNAPLPRETLFILTGAIFVGVTLVGILTFAQAVRRINMLILYTRGLNRIRHCFVEFEPGVAKYLILPINDNVPAFRGRLGDEPQVIALVNSTIVATCTMVYLNSYPRLLYLGAGIIAFAVSYFAHHAASIRIARKVQQMTKVKFPTDVAISDPSLGER